MSEPIVFVDSSEIREGKLEEVKMAFLELAEFVETNESRPIAYTIYLDESRMRVTVLQIHPDSGSMELHMELAGPVFARFGDLVTLRSVDVYGKPSEQVLQQLRKKVDVLGDATIAVHDRHAGFVRIGDR